MNVIINNEYLFFRSIANAAERGGAGSLALFHLARWILTNSYFEGVSM